MLRMTLIATMLGGLTAACAPTGAGRAGEPRSEDETVLPKVALGPTTDGTVALRNLTAQTEAALAAFERHPQPATARRALDLLLSRVQFTGLFEDFDVAFTLTDAALERWGERPDSWLMRADILSAVHRFDEALGALDRAETLGASTQDERRTTYLLALGEDLERVRELREAAYEARASFETRTDLAGACAALGDFERADTLYREALEAYGDVSPFPLAWVQFQRGVMWGEMADQADHALVLYREAVALLPGYVVAHTHLAELEVGTPEGPEAIARLRALVETTGDPEPAGKLAGYLADSDPETSAAYREQAERGYDALLSSHPEAFFDHASEFFAGDGMDPQRGLDLALANVALRKNARAYLVALGAADAAGDDDILCELVDEAGGIEGENLNLDAELATLAPRCP